MAIFESKHDAALPLITQLMQIDSDDDAEVSRFWWRVVENAQLVFPLEANPPVVDPHFKSACHYIQDIVLSLYENQTVPLGRLFALRVQTSLRSGFFPKQEAMAILDVVGGAAPSDDYEERFMPLSDFVWTTEPRNVLPSQIITAELETLLGELWHKRAYLEKCPECQNIFVARKQGSVYCSHRCANTAGTRRRRAERSEKKVSTF